MLSRPDSLPQVELTRAKAAPMAAIRDELAASGRAPADPAHRPAAAALAGPAASAAEQSPAPAPELLSDLLRAAHAAGAAAGAGLAFGGGERARWALTAANAARGELAGRAAARAAERSVAAASSAGAAAVAAVALAARSEASSEPPMRLAAAFEHARMPPSLIEQQTAAASAASRVPDEQLSSHDQAELRQLISASLGGRGMGWGGEELELTASPKVMADPAALAARRAVALARRCATTVPVPAGQSSWERAVARLQQRHVQCKGLCDELFGLSDGLARASSGSGQLADAVLGLRSPSWLTYVSLQERS